MNINLNKYIDKPYESLRNEDDLSFALIRAFDSEDKNEVVNFLYYWITIETICSFIYEKSNSLIKNGKTNHYNFRLFIKNNESFVDQVTKIINENIEELLENMSILLEKPIAPFANYEFLSNKQDYYYNISFKKEASNVLTFDEWFNHLFKDYYGNNQEITRNKNALRSSLESFKAIYRAFLKHKKNKSSLVKKTEAIKICDTIRIIRNNLFHCNKGSYNNLKHLDEESRDYKIIKSANWFMKSILYEALLQTIYDNNI